MRAVQPRDVTGEGGLSEEEKARMVLEDIVERLPEAYDMEDIRACALHAVQLLCRPTVGSWAQVCLLPGVSCVLCAPAGRSDWRFRSAASQLISGQKR